MDVSYVVHYAKNPRSIGYYIKRTNDCPYSSGNLFPGYEASSSDVQTDRLPKSARDVATHDRGELRAARRRRRHRRETTQTNAARSPATPTIRSRQRKKDISSFRFPAGGQFRGRRKFGRRRPKLEPDQPRVDARTHSFLTFHVPTLYY